ncbi:MULTISPECIES: hypothetical protein [Pseudomonadaceae]|uniref:Uncharacterized protein n=1 Tax=Pseudomonas denitrificans TaxID=43306 RepID=A0A9X7MW97_PSEDE|nr:MULTISPECIES: hypothetical protein [Pseudomonadaceae]MBD9632713.1 hypothetical protein [Pseudomonas sp. PDM19]MBD9683331.1 hypothetical protein [Pseudomonas sp. PDM20]QEY70578.1 hypothetical protein F1C79_02285 [Pseudomonas denitrificans (nom. rej.)]
MLINGIEYRIQFASDVNPRDGLGLECWADNVPILEIFRDDRNQRYVVNLFQQDVPLEILEALIPTARKELGDFMP